MPIRSTSVASATIARLRCSSLPVKDLGHPLRHVDLRVDDLKEGLQFHDRGRYNVLATAAIAGSVPFTMGSKSRLTKLQTSIARLSSGRPDFSLCVAAAQHVAREDVGALHPWSACGHRGFDVPENG